MTVATENPTSVWVVGSSPGIRGAIARLLATDPKIKVRGTSEGSVPEASSASVIIDDAMLQELQSLSIGDFIDMVKSLGPTPPARHLRPVPSEPTEKAELSARELEVVCLVAEGLTNKQISLRLELSDKTVKNHISHILAKLQLTARTQVAVHALRTGLA